MNRKKSEELANQRKELIEKGVPEKRICSFNKHGGIYYDEGTGLMVIREVNGSITSKKVTPEKLVEAAVPHKKRGNPLPVRILVVIKEKRPDALSTQDLKRIEAWEAKKKKKH